jgi:uncharacterized protein
MSDAAAPEASAPPVTELKARLRRVLGVLVEKAFTTPEYYPLTLKAVTTGCNQKSNRDPVVEFNEDEVYEALDQLRQIGLVAVVHTETGRTERFRHYFRKRFTLSEPQIAILTELLLRGRQQLGELRGRASRMVPIDTLDQLRDELSGLLQLKLVQSSGDPERRGIEVDHNLYTEKERPQHTLAGGQRIERRDPAEPVRLPTPQTTGPSADVSTLRAEVDRLHGSQDELRETVSRLEVTVADLQRELESLKRDLGVA